LNLQYWEEYYRNEQPSDFAKFCLTKIPHDTVAKIADVGCGNGRDAYFFGSLGHSVMGFDFAFKPRNSWGVDFYKLSINKLVKENYDFDIIYSRFLLHSITPREIEKLIKWSKGTFMAEFRDAEDKPKLFKKHKRTKVNGEWVKSILEYNGFEIIHYQREKGLAKYRGEDPLIVRVIARKRVSV
jgi:SAM-dependent methyltransferase